MIQLYSGETLDLGIRIVSDDIQNLDNAKIVFVLKHQTIPDFKIEKEPVIDGITALVRLESNDTLIAGTYKMEFRGMFGDVTKVIDFDTLVISHANIREVITNE